MWRLQGKEWESGEFEEEQVFGYVLRRETYQLQGQSWDGGMRNDECWEKNKKVADYEVSIAQGLRWNLISSTKNTTTTRKRMRKWHVVRLSLIDTLGFAEAQEFDYFEMECDDYQEINDSGKVMMHALPLPGLRNVKNSITLTWK